MVTKLSGVVTPALSFREHDSLPQGHAVAEFFAGIGLARMGLEKAGFVVSWANDIDPAKQRLYRANFGDDEFLLGDVAAVDASDLPAGLSLAWASFPCTDLSLAGNREGIRGTESGAFWEFARVLDELADRRPPVIAVENVVGLATSHGGRDIRAAITELNRVGYTVDVLTLEARRFVPQSRPRLFLIGMTEPPDLEDRSVNDVRPEWMSPIFEEAALRTVRTPLPPSPALRSDGLTALLERVPRTSDLWWDEERTRALVNSLSSLQRQRLAKLENGRRNVYRTAYRRTRNGKAVWEVRSDDISGCLRTARGGSSKQALVAVGQGDIRARWMTPREYARLMGADEFEIGVATRNEAIDGFGDAVCVPVIAWLAEHYLMPLVSRLTGTGLVACGS